MRFQDRDQLLRAYGLYENTYSPEPFFAQTLLLASKICDTPVAYISIIGDKQQYILSQYGAQLKTMDKKNSICQYTIEGEDVLIIPDTTKDVRTQSLEIVHDAKQPIGFYAGYPLIDEQNNKLGAFCITDKKKREISEQQAEMLKILSKQVVAFLSIRRGIVESLQKQGKEEVVSPNTTTTLFAKIDELNEELTEKNKILAITMETVEGQKKELLHMTNMFPGSIAKINTNYQYIFNNKKYEEWTGLKREDIYLKPVKDIIGEEKFLKLKPLYDRVFLGETIHTEGIFQFDKAKRYLRVAYFPAARGSKIEGAYVFAEDLTEIKSYQSQLESSNENLQSFAQVVSHDIKSPLRLIVNFGNLMKVDLEGKNAEYNDEYLAYIINAGQQLTDLTSDLLNFAKVGHSNDEKQAIAIKQLLDTIQLNLFEIIKSENALIEYEVNDETIYGYYTDFLLLFQNFLSNAIKYRRAEVDPIINLEINKKENKFEFKIKDNGRGIPADKYELIFQPFKRLAGNKGIEGTGIGLATCKKILEKYDATIEINSELGVGTCFSFVLPSSEDA